MYPLDDDDIENAIYLRHAKASQLPKHTSPNEPIVIESSPTPPSQSPENSDTPHGLNINGQPACCSENDTILVDCNGCLTGQVDKMLCSLNDHERGVAKRILDALQEASGEGISKDLLLVSTKSVYLWKADKADIRRSRRWKIFRQV